MESAMQVKAVTVSSTARINLGDYQSRDFFVSMTGELDEGDTPVLIAQRLRKLADAALLSNLAAHFKARGNKVPPETIAKRYGISLPVEKKS
jgi:hypothetical protein